MPSGGATRVHDIMLIVSGLVLLAGSLRVVPALGKYLEQVAKALAAFQGIIGVVALIVGLLSLFSLGGIVLVLAGLLLGVSILGTLPNFGQTFKDIGKFLGGFQVALGVVALVLGVLGIIGQLGRFH